MSHPDSRELAIEILGWQKIRNYVEFDEQFYR